MLHTCAETLAEYALDMIQDSGSLFKTLLDLLLLLISILFLLVSINHVNE